jgi:hypothetical protein
MNFLSALTFSLEKEKYYTFKAKNLPNLKNFSLQLYGINLSLPQFISQCNELHLFSKRQSKKLCFTL